MKMYSRIFTILLVAILLVVCGCTQQSNDPIPGDQYPFAFTDDAGRSVTINSLPERIISFAPAHTETLFALGLQHEIVGVDDWSNYPAETAGITKVGDTFAPNYEVIMSLEPDLVITVGTAESPLVTRLDELSIPVVVLQGTSLSDILEDMEIIGKICGKQAEAEILVSDLHERITAVVEKVDQISVEERVTVFYEVSPPGVWGLWTIGPDSFIHDLITTAGGINVSEDTPGDYFGYSEEVLLEKNPEVIITPNPETPVELSVDKRLTWNSIAAVQEGRVYLVDADQVSRPGPRLINVLEQIVAVLYPELS